MVVVLFAVVSGPEEKTKPEVGKVQQQLLELLITDITDKNTDGALFRSTPEGAETTAQISPRRKASSEQGHERAAS